MRSDHSEEVQIKAESIPCICIIAGFRARAAEGRLANLGTAPGAAPRLARKSREEWRLQSMLMRGDSEACPGSGATDAAGRWAGCWGTAPVPDGREFSGTPKGENRLPAPRGRAVPRSLGGRPPVPLAAVVKVMVVGMDSLLPPGDICAAEPARRLPGWLAGGSRPGGSHRHQRAGIKGLTGTLAPPGGEALGRLQPPAPPAGLPRRLPAALPPAGPGSGEAPGAPAVAHCSRNQTGLSQAAAVLGATGLAAAAPGEGMPGDTLFSHFIAAKLEFRGWYPGPPASARSPLRARLVAPGYAGLPRPRTRHPDTPHTCGPRAEPNPQFSGDTVLLRALSRGCGQPRPLFLIGCSQPQPQAGVQPSWGSGGFSPHGGPGPAGREPGR